MAEELEFLWQKLKVTEEEEESVNLGSECSKAANERGKNCLVMKVLSRRGVILDALRKNVRMLWKPNKSIGISMIEEEMFLVEFDDERDKRRVLEMSPWHYEKQLVLLQDFDGDQDPKDIVFKWSPFWVQMYNLPLKHRTRETGIAIEASLGEVLEVDVADSGVQWGKCLRVRVKIDVSRKLIRGRKINVDEGVARWVLFKYERLPNFCYRCGLLEHDLKDCTQKEELDKTRKIGELQYGAWMRGVQGRIPDDNYRFSKAQTSRNETVGTDKRKSVVQNLGEKTLDSTTLNSVDRERSSESYQEKGLVNTMDETQRESIAILVKEGVDRKQTNNGFEGCGQETEETQQTGVPKFKFEPAEKV
ncbi:uncharacterized protein LOC115951782 [Quercus lobata]|uniref:uncharacterized protein LOC115951782 n=1 Tax=Quercus lobata TaxID=97700 RepID=UPI00124903B3|nr:uncharacterized protein LOC115951782 [Quercus lobata]